jgi:uncharacterized peroxidase-related enzyme
MSWIRTIPYAESDGRLRDLYDRIRGPHGEVDNIMQVHSLRPHTMEGHLRLYKNVLHHRGNHLPTVLLELIGVYVSLLNGCDYCVEHHFTGLRRLLDDDDRAAAIRRRLQEDELGAPLDVRERAALGYARRLTGDPAGMNEDDLAPLRQAGFTDAEILEINQVVAYFAYANRTVLGLGVSTDGDVLGLSPEDTEDPDDWHHG